MKFIFALAVLALAIATAEGVNCGNDACVNVHCATDPSKSYCAKHGKVYRENASTCGCCGACVTKVLTGQPCKIPEGNGAPVFSACEDGSLCEKVWTKGYVCVKQ